MKITTCLRVKCFNAYLDKLEKAEVDPKKYCSDFAKIYATVTPYHLVNYLISTVKNVNPEEFNGYPVFKDRLSKFTEKLKPMVKCPFTGKYWDDLVFDDHYFKHVFIKFLSDDEPDINVLY